MMVVLGQKDGSSSEGRVPLEVAGSSPACRTKKKIEKLNLPHYLPNRVSKMSFVAAVLLSFNASLADGTGYMVVRYFKPAGWLLRCQKQ